MKKTVVQEKLELQHGKPFEDVLRDTLESHRGRRNMVTSAALELGVTDATIYTWCRSLDIEVDRFRYLPSPDEPVSL